MNKEIYDTKLATEQCFRTHKYLTSFKYVQCSFSNILKSYKVLFDYIPTTAKSRMLTYVIYNIIVTSVVTLCYVCQIIVKNHIKSGIKYNISCKRFSLKSIITILFHNYKISYFVFIRHSN